RCVRDAGGLGARPAERLSQQRRRQPRAARGRGRGTRRRPRSPRLPGGRGRRRPCGGRRAACPWCAHRAGACATPGRLRLVLLPRPGRQPRADPLGSRDHGVREASRGRLAAAWGVHLLTASSAPAGILALLAAERRDAATAFWWMAYTLAVDAI